MNADQISKELMDFTGADNIENITHCSMRLRLTVRRLDQIDTNSIRKIESVLGVVKQGNTLQIIFGPKVESVYAAFLKLYETEKKSGAASAAPEKAGSLSTREKNLFSRGLSFFAAAFLPTLPVIIATGLISAILNVLVLTAGLQTDSPTYTLISTVASTGFYFLPLYVGYGVAKSLNLNPIYGIFLGAVLVNSGIDSVEGLSFFGIPIMATAYSYSALPVLLGVVLMAWIHRKISKVIPAVLREVLVPLIVISVGVLVTLIVIGPLGVWVGDLLAKALALVHDTIGWPAVALVGAGFGFTVIAGVNKALVPLMTATLAAYGYDNFLVPAMLGTNIAIGTAALAVAWMEKDKNKKGTFISAGIAGIMGISEPSLFGVLLGDRKALLGSVLGGFAGGLVAGITNLGQNAIVSGLPALPTLIISAAPYEGFGNLINGIITVLVAGAVGFVATIVLKKQKNLSLKAKDGK